MRDSEQIELIHGVGPSRASELRELGLETIGDIATAEPSTLAEVTGIGHELALELRRSARRFIASEEGGINDGVLLDFGNPHEVTLGADVIESLRVELPESDLAPKPPNDDPLAVFRVDQRCPALEEVIEVDASPSTGDIERFAWDFEFDGAFTPERESDESRETHAYETSGEREIALRVTDSDGRTDLVSKPVSVGNPSDGPAVRFELEDGFERENGLLRRVSGRNQSFTAETSLDAGIDVDVRLTDFPAGMPFDTTTESVESDGRLRGSFDLRDFDRGTYFFEARRSGAVLGRVSVGIFRIVIE